MPPLATVITAPRSGAVEGDERAIQAARKGVTTYDRAELKTLLSDGWRGDDYALFRYKPARFQRHDAYNAATRLVLDFKKNEAEALDEVLAWCVGTMTNLEDELKRTRNVRYVLALPRSAAGAANIPCEWIAGHLAATFDWLSYMPHALQRTESITPAHKSVGARPDVSAHKATIRYTGDSFRTASSVVEGLYCHACRKAFHTPGGLDWHVTNNREHARNTAAVAQSGGPPAVLMLDDVITRGATSQACRELLTEAGAARAIGFFVARTG